MSNKSYMSIPLLASACYSRYRYKSYYSSQDPYNNMSLDTETFLVQSAMSGVVTGVVAVCLLDSLLRSTELQYQHPSVINLVLIFSSTVSLFIVFWIGYAQKLQHPMWSVFFLRCLMLNLLSGFIVIRTCKAQSRIPIQSALHELSRLISDEPISACEKNCAVCLDEYNIGTIVAKLPCGHSFCLECFCKILQRFARCPYCNQQIKKIASVEIGKIRMAQELERIYEPNSGKDVTTSGPKGCGARSSICSRKGKSATRKNRGRV